VIKSRHMHKCDAITLLNECGFISVGKKKRGQGAIFFQKLIDGSKHDFDVALSYHAPKGWVINLMTDQPHLESLIPKKPASICKVRDMSKSVKGTTRLGKRSALDRIMSIEIKVKFK
jgi:hypothetical protein